MTTANKNASTIIGTITLGSGATCAAFNDTATDKMTYRLPSKVAAIGWVAKTATDVQRATFLATADPAKVTRKAKVPALAMVTGVPTKPAKTVKVVAPKVPAKASVPAAKAVATKVPAKGAKVVAKVPVKVPVKRTTPVGPVALPRDTYRTRSVQVDTLVPGSFFTNDEMDDNSVWEVQTVTVLDSGQVKYSYAPVIEAGQIGRKSSKTVPAATKIRRLVVRM